MSVVKMSNNDTIRDGVLLMCAQRSVAYDGYVFISIYLNLIQRNINSIFLKSKLNLMIVFIFLKLDGKAILNDN